jgi:hypothetical protein
VTGLLGEYVGKESAGDGGLACRWRQYGSRYSIEAMRGVWTEVDRRWLEGGKREGMVVMGGG